MAGASPSPRASSRAVVVVAGPPASGKTTVAARLASRMGVAWADTDADVAREAGRPVPEVFAREGEAGFRAREKRAVLARLDAGAPCVLAVGGGALVDRALRHEVLRRAWVVALDAPLDVLAERAARDPSARPLVARAAGGDVRAALAALLEARAGAYAEAHATVHAEGDPDDVAARALDAARSLAREPALVVPLGARTYRVHVARIETLPSRVRALAPSSALCVTDARVARALSARGVLDAWPPELRVTLPGRGDRDKTVARLAGVWTRALAAGLDRDGVLVAVGGGVVSDLAGFAAATLLRGVRYATAPTTLLAMVDASVGGKTGVDHPLGKNLVGAFHHPSVVVADPSVIATQPARDVRAGLAEVAKVALVRDAALWARLGADGARLAACDVDAIAPLVPPAIQAKIDVVARDEREAGERAVLNFGHTIGHAIERAAGYRAPHGECVAVGMRAALALGVAVGVTPAAVAREANDVLDALGMPRAAPRGVRLDDALAALAHDKKRRGAELRFVLCDRVGSAVVAPVARADALAALRGVLEIRAGRRRPLPSR